MNKEIKNIIYLAILTCKVLVSPSFSQDLISQIGWNRATPGVIMGIVSVVTSGFVMLLVLHIRTQKKAKKISVEASRDAFSQYIQKAGLVDREEKILVEMSGEENPNLLIQSSSFFERCIHNYVEKLISQNDSEKHLEVMNEQLGVIRKKLGHNFLPFEHPLVSTRNMSIGQRLSVHTHNGGELLNNALVVRNEELSFYLSYRVEQEDVVDVGTGSMLNLCFTRHNDGIYNICAQVRRSTPGCIEFFHSFDIKRNQLRQFMRLEVSFSVRFRLITTVSPEHSDLAGIWLQGRVTDIGGGGLSIVYGKSFVPGDIFLLNIMLSNGTLSGVKAKLLRVSLIETNDCTKYKHHLQFISIDSAGRDKIVRFVFEKLRQINQMR
ncbi:PilZ domain-containing protein [Chitinispirillales bacterium ANBcel5]|uniref:flagellar brake protein n=1 Tax=Cellulosispirillum alkaliphilum TaxID=3039283 RepID=UPI002A55EF6D|nr:PilZ domain-containing protein [Chitinispirillales bacterium ANBcel5]